MIKHVNIWISGLVQRVGFRYSTLETAKEMNIKGFVKNLPNGDVYIEAEGRTENIENFIKWCHHGPKWAKVESVRVEEGILKDFQSFEIQRD